MSIVTACLVLMALPRDWGLDTASVLFSYGWRYGWEVPRLGVEVAVWDNTAMHRCGQRRAATSVQQAAVSR